MEWKRNGWPACIERHVYHTIAYNWIDKESSRSLSLLAVSLSNPSKGRDCMWFEWNLWENNRPPKAKPILRGIGFDQNSLSKKKFEGVICKDADDGEKGSDEPGNYQRVHQLFLFIEVIQVMMRINCLVVHAWPSVSPGLKPGTLGRGNIPLLEVTISPVVSKRKRFLITWTGWWQLLMRNKLQQIILWRSVTPC